jgi:hypothetical protein
MNRKEQATINWFVFTRTQDFSIVSLFTILTEFAGTPSSQRCLIYPEWFMFGLVFASDEREVLSPPHRYLIHHQMVWIRDETNRIVDRDQDNASPVCAV